MLAYKRFNSKLQEDKNGKLFQYELGKSYTAPEGDLLENGFRACKDPLDLLMNHNVTSRDRYCVVQLSIPAKFCEDIVSEYAAQRITITRELSLSDLFEEHEDSIYQSIDHRKIHITPEGKDGEAGKKNNSKVINKNWSSVSSNTGEMSIAHNEGTTGVAANTGHESLAKCYGAYSAAIETGINSISRSNGDGSIAGGTGLSSFVNCKGQNSVAVETGAESIAIASNQNSIAASTGDGSLTIAQDTGSVAIATGKASLASVEKSDSIAIAAGVSGKVKGALGCWLVLTEREAITLRILGMKCVKVDGEKIRPDICYTLKNGAIVEAEEEKK